MTKTIGMLLLVAGISQYLVAGVAAAAPEINPESAAAGLALLSGALLIIRGRQRK